MSTEIVLQPARAALARIEASPAQVEAVATKLWISYGVDIWDVPFEGERLGFILEQLVDPDTSVAIGEAAAAGAHALGTTFAAVAGLANPAVGVAILAVTQAFAVVQSIREPAQCENRRQRMMDNLRSDIRAVSGMLSPGTDVNSSQQLRIRYRLWELLPYWSGTATLARADGGPYCSGGFLNYGGWTESDSSGPEAMPQGFAWTDGSTGTRKGIRWACGGRRSYSRCRSLTLVEAHKSRMSLFRQELEAMTLNERLQYFAGLLGVFLSPFGDPTVGLEDVLRPVQRSYSLQNATLPRYQVSFRPGYGDNTGGGGGGILALAALGAAAWWMTR